jgi:uncharacterized protein (TIGR02118 family)
MSPNRTTVSVLYPRTANSTFELDYYLSKHMPLLAKFWTKYGLKSWSVTQLSEDAPYSTHTLMEWDSTEAFGKAFQDARTQEVMADEDNFSSEKPILVQENVVGRE